MERTDLSALRLNYMSEPLDEHMLDPDPIVQFGRWFAEAQNAGIDDVNAMTLSTVAADGAPRARVVLLKGFGPDGFEFFTNRQSAKGREMAHEPRVSLSFFWQPLARQVRIGGTVEQLSAEQSDAYFATRPRESQIGAWASPQSEVVAGREEIEARLRHIQQRFGHGPVPRPPHWGGYRVLAASMEFWQGRPDRLHDRVVYTRSGAEWQRVRLAP
jgi:pyridoxamine 5'-phosphate oxidase